MYGSRRRLQVAPGRNQTGFKHTLKEHFVTNRSGVKLCLHKIEASDTCVGTVILAHGMFSNYRFFRGLASYLSTLNYDCWLMDFQGHGFSTNPEQEPDLESMSLEDTESVLDFVHRTANVPIWWVGHSGGGLAVLMYLARHPHQQGKFSGIVTVASQASDAGLNYKFRIFFKACRVLLKFIPKVPGKALRLGPEDEFTRVLDQWLAWSISKRWLGNDEFDYLAHMSNIQLPALVIAGAGDKYIAPVSGCKKLYDSLASTDKTFLLFSKEKGYSENYRHDRIISSHNASVDVWPAISEWIGNRST